MITFENVSLTEGHIARHTPTGSGAPGREAAIIDIAQDFLLSYLEDHGKMDKVSLKGGTAIRKFYAGREGRFSLDLDFSIDDQYTDSNELALEFVSEIDGLKIGPFSYSVSERRNKWYIGLSSPYNDGEIFRTKLDFASYPWLEPVKRSIIALPIHKQYGFELPPIHTVRLEENIAEKIARLNRTNTARDMYDLNWLLETKAISTTIDKKLLKRLVVLKIWVDSYGMHYGNIFWHPAHSPSVFDPNKWLNERNPADVDAEDIGTLAVPAPTPEDLIKRLKTNYSFLAELDEVEKTIAKSNQKDRGLVIQVLSELPGNRLGKGLY
ncbi:MAG: nucleotidyl transferase AbiEii/AbiGii toxin family protein [Lachnospiraceae bacterium]|nr:nucleotidyl transferase AbiEii/AbiGii toxin family protein [Lachnospiraceae bacterium]